MNLSIFDINKKFQQLKHHQSYFIFIIISFIKVKNISELTSNFLNLKIIIFMTVISTIFLFISLLFLDELINLNFIIIII